MERSDILGRVGSMQQLAYARRIRYEEGRAAGMRAIEVKNGDVRFVAMEDKALDVSEFEYRGVSLGFLSKPGLNGRNPFDTLSDDVVRSIMGGMFFTCGFENIGAPYTDAEGKRYPLHGRIRTSPAEHVRAGAGWEGDDYAVTLSGEVREAELFGENLVLRRTVSSRLGEASIAVADEVVNEGFTPQPMMFMYHCNVGWPLLSESAEIVIPSIRVAPRDEAAARDEADWSTVQAPVPDKPESVFIHTLAAEPDGSTFASVANPELGIALVLEFSVEEFPYFMQWKSMAAGDYVVGLEPSNSSILGRGHHEERGDLHILQPQASEVKHLTVSAVEGREAIARLRRRRDGLVRRGSIRPVL